MNESKRKFLHKLFIFEFLAVRSFNFSELDNELKGLSRNRKDFKNPEHLTDDDLKLLEEVASELKRLRFTAPYRNFLKYDIHDNI